jgi:ADP-ribosylglycohydrolase
MGRPPRRTVLTEPHPGSDLVERRVPRFLGAVTGAMIGDALGHRVTSCSFREMQERFGAQGAAHLEPAGSEQRMSDGIAMLVLSLNGALRADRALNEGVEPLNELRASFEQWLSPVDVANAGWLSEWLPAHLDGSRLVDELSARFRGRSSELPESLYSALPAALWSVRSPEVIEHTRRVVGILGESGQGLAAAEALAVILQQTVITGQFARGTGVATESEAGRRADGHEEIIDALTAGERAARYGITAEQIESLGDGHSPASALAIAVCAVYSATTFDDAVRIAANHSGNSVLTAALAGAMAGGMAEGITNIPIHWFDGLPAARLVYRLAQDVAAQLRDTPPDSDDWRARYPLVAGVVSGAPGDAVTHRIELTPREERFLRHWRDYWWNRHKLVPSASSTFGLLAHNTLGDEAFEEWRARQRIYGIANPARTIVRPQRVQTSEPSGDSIPDSRSAGSEGER